MNWKEVDGKHDDDGNQHFGDLPPGLQLVDEVPVDVGPLAGLGLVRYAQGRGPPPLSSSAGGCVYEAAAAAATTFDLLLLKNGDTGLATARGLESRSSSLLDSPATTEDLLAP